MNYAYQGRICKDGFETEWAVFAYPKTENSFQFCGTPYWAKNLQEAVDYIQSVINGNKLDDFQYVIKYFPTTHLN